MSQFGIEWTSGKVYGVPPAFALRTRTIRCSSLLVVRQSLAAMATSVSTWKQRDQLRLALRNVCFYCWPR